MAAVTESRPGRPGEIHFGDNYAQPNVSVHALWQGQWTRQLEWAGERNAGQPVYLSGGSADNQSEIESRFRQEAGEAYDQLMREKTLFGKDLDNARRNELMLQLLAMAQGE